MRLKTLPVFVAVLALVAACGKSGGTKTVTSVTPTQPTTTTTAAPTVPVAPLTGLPIDDTAKADRVALIVKLDNANEARPQAGLAGVLTSAP